MDLFRVNIDSQRTTELTLIPAIVISLPEIRNWVATSDRFVLEVQGTTMTSTYGYIAKMMSSPIDNFAIQSMAIAQFLDKRQFC
jgi:hypothetical protein